MIQSDSAMTTYNNSPAVSLIPLVDRNEELIIQTIEMCIYIYNIYIKNIFQFIKNLTLIIHFDKILFNLRSFVSKKGIRNMNFIKPISYISMLINENLANMSLKINH